MQIESFPIQHDGVTKRVGTAISNDSILFSQSCIASGKMSPMGTRTTTYWKRGSAVFFLRRTAWSIPILLHLKFNVFKSYVTKNMSNSIIQSMVNLPIELIYRLFDRLDPLDILISVRDVCSLLDQITNTYRRYQVIS